jgi:ubiquinone/menaquinone biosynthesis C-methylase UbiE/DNA-binding transcriptional ArsR family regulator
MHAASLPILDSFSAVSDPVRCRTLWLLDQHELTVSELCTILQLPQSTVSRHLRILSDSGWVSSRRDGTSRYYAINRDDAGLAQIWQVTRAQLDGRAGIAQDARRVATVLARRRDASQQFFATASAEWDRLRAELFGRDFVAAALAALLPSDWIVGDLGCGTGALLPLVAPHVARVIGVDGSEEMLSAARARAAHFDNVDLRAGSLESLPLADASLDAATLMLVLHHLPAPAVALAEAARVLRPGGRLLIVDMAPHEHEEYRQQMGHVWLGFAEDQMRRLLHQAGFERTHVHALPPAADATGPALFAAVAKNHGSTEARKPGNRT